jgi:hypothetical protein
VYDASLSLAYIDGCTSRHAYSWCDPVFSQALAEASAATGEDRTQKLEALSRQFVESALSITLWKTPAIHGAASNFQWENPRQDWLVFNEMSLSE